MSLFSDLNIKYIPTEKILQTGRISDSNLAPQYWHQIIKLLNINNWEEEDSINIGIIGYACDEGVRRNLGRVGAKNGPKALRTNLAKLPIHFDNKTIADLGDIHCIDNNMEACQKALSYIISYLISKKIFPIVIGGGHDVAYGNFMGIKKGLNTTSEKRKIGIINFDAHFDLRPVKTLPNSGTPFNQILNQATQKDELVNYFVIGIQQQSNTKELFDIAKKKNVQFVSHLDCICSENKVQNLKEKLFQFIEKNDYIYLTIDMDAFSSAYSPGVSATSSLGFSPQFIYEILPQILKTGKVISCDIAELNPIYDIDNKTSKLAAKILDLIVSNAI